jgi:mRNA-degrading endonuclease RelE of RelBE toxin-antitoxin system
MSYRVLSIPLFDKQFKRLAKKYPSLKKELKELSESLEQHPGQGTPLGRNCYKIRLAIASKGKGKSGGARVITNIAISVHNVYRFPFMINKKEILFQMLNCKFC